MKTKYFHLLVLIIILNLIIVMGSQLFNKVNTNSPQTAIEYVSIENNDISPDLQQSTENGFENVSALYYIFANSINEYNSIKEQVVIIKDYPNLEAIQSSLSQRDLLYLRKTTSANIIPSNLMKQNIYQSAIESSNNPIKLNGLIEANKMGVSNLWDLGYNGTGVTVAIFDDGIDFTHPSLTGRNSSDPILFNTWEGETKQPCKTHGTQVAGLISSGEVTYKGNAPGSKLLSMEFGCDGTSLIGDPIAGFNWLITQNDTIKVVNLSWGTSSGNYFEKIIEKLTNAGIIVVASAGNSGSESFSVTDPGTALNAITVGAIDGNGVVTGFSGRGPSTKYQTKPDILAPGVGIITTRKGGGLTSFSGTSASTPLVAGGIATLVSALEANGISWNVGTIKAALMRTAIRNSGNEFTEGQGLVNFTAAWEYLMNTNRSDNIPMVVEITPSIGPYSLFQTLPQNVVAEVPFSLISSNPQLVNIQITGNLSAIASIQPINPKLGSQIISLIVDTNTDFGVYKGIINATIGNDFVEAQFTITIEGTTRGRILFDLRHTNWDMGRANVIDGANTGEMIKIAQTKGFWVEEVDRRLTSSLLNNYDILWMADPLSLSDDPFYAPEPLYQDEIDAISDFVDKGGSLFVDFNGLFKDTKGVFGTNSTGINSLISRFGITTNTDPITEPVGETFVHLHNSSSLVGKATKVTHLGNYLNVNNHENEISHSVDGPTIAIYDQMDKGRVIVSSSNFWLDNFGAKGNYDLGGGIDDKIFAENVWEWLASSQRLHKISANTVNNKIQIKFSTTNITDDPSVKIYKKDEIINNYSITERPIDSMYSLEFTVEDDGDYSIVIALGDEYIRWEFKFDIKPPEIIPLNSGFNMSEVVVNGKVYLSFVIVDEIDTLDKTLISVTLDNVEIISVSYRNDINRATITLEPDQLQEVGHWYTLQITASDLSNNKNTKTYFFFVGQEPTSTPTIPTVVTTLQTSTHDKETSTTEKTNLFGPFPFFLVLVIAKNAIGLLTKQKKK